MSGAGGEENDTNRHAAVETPPTLWQRFVRGHRWVAIASLGTFAGAMLTVGVLTGGHRMAVGAMPSGARHVVWIGLAGLAFLLLSAPDKHLAIGRRGLTFGQLAFGGMSDWLGLAAFVAGSFALCLAVGHLT